MSEPIRPPWLKEDGTPTVEHPPEEHHGITPPEVKGELGPLAKCRAIFETMWGAPRKDVIAACVAVGINKSTASTQYQHFKKKKDSEVVTKNPETGMPQLAPGVQVGNGNHDH